MNNLKEKLMTDAREKGICIDGYKEMHSADRKELVDYYVHNPDWCMERGFPDLQTLTDEFADCEDMGVFVGKTFGGEVLNERQAYIFHNCKGTIKVGLNVEKKIIPMIYVANGCRLRIVGIGEKACTIQSVVPVYMFGKNDISARDNRHIKFKRYYNKLL